MNKEKWSVVIPTYNRLPILTKCLRSLENQDFEQEYEVIVIDDGSTDGTVEFLQTHTNEFPHVKLFQRDHQGASIARNTGVEVATGEIILFIDSDLVSMPGSLTAHARALEGQDKAFTYGRIVNTSNFDDPTSEPFTLTDVSNAYFATGNTAIAKHWFIEAGGFDPDFKQYGWEDLELGVRLKNMGFKIIKCPKALGYHWHPPFTMDEVPKLIDVEKQRGRMGAIFYQKHPTWDVRMIIQMTWLHKALWGLLSFGGALNERSLKPILQFLIDRNRPQLALEIARIFLNWYSVQAVYDAYAQASQTKPTSQSATS
ncbi:glycosyl transferase family 2 [Thalassoporum mexicanum PCC 7367]|uniref:glycosyltransferase family 2 protein n=1 Tax=Thalassoporum mexicanum TaxID=3457544 RepID=UPI00029FB27F|nr:glycosyltransferase family 2 protein [Pseudanabaena sp. PCC 7367]AFY69523.1 glycosyl transferase family 2 [Pseudanabaena sp. PCC 7367]